MKIDASQLSEVARLARLTFNVEDTAKFAQNLSEILSFVEQLEAANTQAVTPMAHPVDAQLPLRADIADIADQRELFQAVAPSVADGLYLVPKVID